jgi:hypothetical protein
MHGSRERPAGLRLPRSLLEPAGGGLVSSSGATPAVVRRVLLVLCGRRLLELGPRLRGRDRSPLLARVPLGRGGPVRRDGPPSPTVAFTALQQESVQGPRGRRHARRCARAAAGGGRRHGDFGKRRGGLLHGASRGAARRDSHVPADRGCPQRTPGLQSLLAHFLPPAVLGVQVQGFVRAVMALRGMPREATERLAMAVSSHGANTQAAARPSKQAKDLGLDPGPPQRAVPGVERTTRGTSGGMVTRSHLALAGPGRRGQRVSREAATPVASQR